MPTVIYIDGFRFFFYSNEGSEPPHIHIEKGDYVSKFWIPKAELAYNYGFNGSELNKLRKLVLDNSELFINKWNEYFNR